MIYLVAKTPSGVSKGTTTQLKKLQSSLFLKPRTYPTDWKEKSHPSVGNKNGKQYVKLCAF